MKDIVAKLNVAIAVFLVIAVLFFWLMVHVSVEQSHSPVSRDFILKIFSVSLPPSAHNIQYASYTGGMQYGGYYIRCEAPVSDCLNAAKQIFAEQAKEDKNFVIPQFEPVSHPEPETNPDVRLDWFDINNISNGVVAGGEGSWQPKIWIDEDRGVLYYETCD